MKMKPIRSSSLLTLLASFLLVLGTQNYLTPSALQFASASEINEPPASKTLILAEYNKQHGLKRVINWGLAKIENLYDGILVSDLISAFITAADHIFAIMIHSFKELTLSYEELHTKEVERLGQFDTEFKSLVKLRNKIDRKCLYASNIEERSLCIDKGMEIQDRIQTLRSQRSTSEKGVERYKEMIGWCKSYNNWIC